MPDDQLSQNEIDALFTQLTQTASEAPESARERFRSVRPYDFRHPSKLSKDQLRTLQMIFEGFARLVSGNLSAILRSQVHAALVSVEQSVFDDYVRALPQRTLLHLATGEPLSGTFVFEYDMGTAFMIIDRLLGGIGKALAQERDVTNIEDMLLQSTASVFLDAWVESWAHILPMKARLQRLEYSPRFLQIAPQNEPVVLLLFDLRIHDRQTTLSLCIPYSVIEPVAQQLNMQALFEPSRRIEAIAESEDAPMRLQRVKIPIVAFLGGTMLPTGTVNDLTVGDVIRLDGLASDPLLACVNGRPTYVARPGLVRHSLAIQVLGVLQDGDTLA